MKQDTDEANEYSGSSNADKTEDSRKYYQIKRKVIKDEGVTKISLQISQLVDIVANKVETSNSNPATRSRSLNRSRTASSLS